MKQNSDDPSQKLPQTPAHDLSCDNLASEECSAKTTNQPLVTVGVALYNHQEYIRQCLASIVEQHYPNIQLIVIDDGSSDNSFAVARDFLESQDKLVNYTITSRPNRGMCHTLNEIAQQAEGKYISFVGSDDYWHRDKIRDQVQYLEEHPTEVLVHSNSQKVDGENHDQGVIDYSRKVNSGRVYEALIHRTGGINTPSHLYRTSIYEEIGYYDPEFRFEDTDFWLRLSKLHDVGYINKIHSYYRWHGENLSGEQNALSFYYDELIRIYDKNIDDPNLKGIAISRIYRKAMLRSFKGLRLLEAFKYFRLYRRWRPRS